MTKAELRQLIAETIQEMVNEGYNFDTLAEDMPCDSEISDYYNQVLRHLANLMNEVDGFNSRYGHTMQTSLNMREKFPETTYMAKLKQIYEILAEIHPGLKAMANVQKHDNW